MSKASPEWVDPFSPRGTRLATAKILTGRNYRLFYDGATRRTLLETYRELAALARMHPSNSAAWQDHIRELISNHKLEDKRLREWLIGLRKKTASNLGVRVAD